MRALILLSIFCALVSAQTPAAKAPATPAKKAPAKSAAPNPRLMHPELWKAKAPDLYRAKISTAKGDFVIEVHRDWAPLGADRFYNLVRSGYFVGDAFYRVISGVFAQFGINPEPTVTRVWSTAPIKDDVRTQHNTPGTVVFATSGPNQRTTQLFINYQDNSSSLDASNFAPIGTISEGFDVAKNLYSGYGEMKEQPGGTGPSQELYTKEGKTYLDRSFPMLDKITAATIIFPEAPPPAAKKSAPATKAPAKK